MNENIVEGATKELGGNIKQAAGSLTEDRSLEAEGAGDRVEGRTQKSFGHLQAAAKDAVAPAANFVREKPVTAIGIAAAAGAGLLALFGLGRRKKVD